MITIERLLEVGYRAYFCDNHIADNKFYQRWVYSGDTKLYTINITIWYFDKHSQPKVTFGTRISCSVRFSLENQPIGNGLSLEMSVETTADIEMLEAFYANAYRALNCVPDIHNRG